MKESNTFVRESFYIDPPTQTSTPEQWEEWIKQDNRQAAAAKRKYTKHQKHCELPDFAQGNTMRKIGGVWRQSTPIGFSGDIEAGGHLEPTVEASQEHDYIRAQLVGTIRGNKKLKNGGQKYKARRAARKARKLRGKE
jgi:hypothetical protein